MGDEGEAKVERRQPTKFLCNKRQRCRNHGRVERLKGKRKKHGEDDLGAVHATTFLGGLFFGSLLR